MKTSFWAKALPLVGTALLATIMGLPLPVAAQGRGDGPPPAADIAKMQAREADDIALVLVLRPEQRPALAAFLQSMMPPPPPPSGRDGRGPGPDESPRTDAAPPSDGFAQHLDRMAKDVARRSADDTRRLTVARTFYDGLDPTQRRTFEALMRLRHGPGPGGRGRGPGRGGPGRGGPGGHGPDGDGPPPMDGMPPRP
ncbi:hypothetical protein VH567_04170 [Sphingomonas sp. 4RDLI-65]|uniref:hypothetical protein n=1 Tax=Sphingomonas sp. 4RDLI-65 TaxID=3111641 RepID=UPI003C168D0D